MIIDKMKRMACIGLTALLTLSNIQLPTYGIQATDEADNIIPEGVVLNEIINESGILGASISIALLVSDSASIVIIFCVFAAKVTL